MEHLSHVQARIETIRGMVEGAMPAGVGRFSSVLADALRHSGGGAPPAGAGGVAVASAGEAASLLRLPGMGMGTAAGDLRLPVEARVSSEFGPRTHPVSGERHEHSGIDFAAPAGSPVRAAAAGTVAFAGERGGYGNLVIIRHPDGAETYYAHQRDLSVRTGQPVSAGQLVGTVGSTGRSTGPHLHFELRRDGRPVDPRGALGLPAA
jgi:murein DD-endopeptidase MepM/ murein hydrolase activator NlpD